jgi:hypothetical protein
MSEAFKQQWLRTSAAKRLLIMLTSLAKSGDITFDLDALEMATPGDGVRQRFVGNKLVISYRDPSVVAAEAEQTFIIEQAQAMERKVESKWPTNDETPERLTEILSKLPPRQPAVTTMDDAEMAAREAQQQRVAVQREAARRRDQPLPLTQPPMQS